MLAIVTSFLFVLSFFLPMVNNKGFSYPEKYVFKYYFNIATWKIEWWRIKKIWGEEKKGNLISCYLS